jgi:hypothetical protein
MPSGGSRSTTWDAETAVEIGKRGGRPLGAKDKVPRSVKASIKKIFEEIGSTDRELIREAIMRGIQAEPPKSFPYLQLAAAYVDGRPAENVKVEIGMRRVNIINRFADGETKMHSYAVGPVDELDATDEPFTIDAEPVVAALPAADPVPPETA